MEPTTREGDERHEPPCAQPRRPRPRFVTIAAGNSQVPARVFGSLGMPGSERDRVGSG